MEDATIDLFFSIRLRAAPLYHVDATLRRPGGVTDVELTVNAPFILDQAALLARESDPLDYGRELGRQLFAAAELRAAWDKARGYAASARTTLRLRLALDPDDELLHTLRWETIHDSEGLPLAFNQQVLLSRYLASADLTDVEPAPRSALRATIVVAAPPDAIATYRLSPIDGPGEAQRAALALQGVAQTLVGAAAGGEPATLTAIRDAAAQAHLLYIVCHGQLAEDGPYLLLETATGGEWVAAGELVQAIQSLEERPRLILLVSCNSAGRGSRALAAVGPRLVQAGIPAVVGAQGDLAIHEAALLMPPLLAGLLGEKPIDRVLADTRLALREGDWWRIALWLRSRGGLLWTSRQRPRLTRRSGDEDRLQIRDLRIACIYAETLLGARATTAGAPLPALGDAEAYKRRFAECQSAGPVPLAGGATVSVPWPKARSQGFWYNYLEQRNLAHLGAGRAWRSQLPLRVWMPWQIEPTLFGGQGELQLYVAPHGVACCILLRCSDLVGLEEATLLASAIRRGRSVRLTRDGDTEQCSLDWLADTALAALTTLQGVAGADGQRAAAEPFTLTAFVQASGVEPEFELQAQSTIHRLLDAYTSWQARPVEALSDSFDVQRIPTSDRLHWPGDLLYGRSRARAIWFPRRFAQQQPGAALACYYNNLTLAALQVELLGGLVRAAADRLEDGEPLLAHQHEWAQLGAGLLGRLFNGSKSETYRSHSCRTQIAENGWLQDLNRLRQLFGQPALPSE